MRLIIFIYRIQNLKYLIFGILTSKLYRIPNSYQLVLFFPSLYFVKCKTDNNVILYVIKYVMDKK